MSISREELRKPLYKRTVQKISFADGTWVNVRPMSTTDFIYCRSLTRVKNGVETDEDNLRFLAAVVARCCVDDKGERYFADDEIDLVLEKGYDFVITVGNTVPNNWNVNLAKSKKNSKTR